MITLEFESRPSLSGSYLRAVLGAWKPRRSSLLPEIRAVQRTVRVEPAAVERFRRLFGLDPTGPVPPTFAHVLAAPLQLQVLTHPEFPVRVLGTVHVRNSIVQLRPLQAGEMTDLQARCADLRQVHNGLEYDVVTEVFDRTGVRVWHGRSTHLLRDPRLQGRLRTAPSGVATAQGGWERSWSFALAANSGRRYAALSGDWNPIHLSALSARLFGFRRAIIHGMWTYAKALAVLEPHLPGEPLAFDIQFRRPLFLPGRAVVRARADADQQGWRFSVEDPRGATVHADGMVRVRTPE